MLFIAQDMHLFHNGLWAKIGVNVHSYRTHRIGYGQARGLLIAIGIVAGLTRGVARILSLVGQVNSTVIHSNSH